MDLWFRLIPQNETVNTTNPPPSTLSPSPRTAEGPWEALLCSGVSALLALGFWEACRQTGQEPLGKKEHITVASTRNPI